LRYRGRRQFIGESGVQFEDYDVLQHSPHGIAEIMVLCLGQTNAAMQ
jgi:hypothetical protein